MKQDADIVIQQAVFDALGRRVKKVVTHSGRHDGSVVYYYQGHQVIETRDGSGNLTMQVYHGTQYIDEVVGLRLEHGRAYVHQDANWNVVALTDLKGAVLERYYYSPYGELEVVAETYFGDYDGNGFVDADDADDLCSNGDGCACEFTSAASGDCRVFDFDCDGDLDNADKHTLEDLYAGLSADMQNRRIPSAAYSPVGNPFGHQGLILDPEIQSYQNRSRQYNPKLKRFMQRDPLAGSSPLRVRPVLPTLGSRGGLGLRNEGLRSYPLNSFQYVLSSPTRWLDPLGLMAGDENSLFTECLCCLSYALAADFDKANNIVCEWAHQWGYTDPCIWDAMQHCVGAALVASRCGVNCTLIGGDLHDPESRRDSHNNAKGVQCTADPLGCCNTKLINGDLDTELDDADPDGGPCY